MNSGRAEVTQISASMLAADLARLGEEVWRVDQAGVDSLHFDIMDGHYVPNLAFSPGHLAALRPYTSLPFSLHLELDNPDYLLDAFYPFEADLITACLDTLPDPLRTLTAIRRRGARAGLCLNPGESVTKILDLLPLLDLVILLAVQPGFGGQPMQPGMLECVAEFASRRDRLGLPVQIAVDGGINQNNAPGLVEAGADVLIMGTALFCAADMRGLVKEIKAISSSRLCR